MRYHPFDCGGFVLAEVPDDLRSVISSAIEQAVADGDSIADRLAGHITRELAVPNLAHDDGFNEFIQTMIVTFHEQYPRYVEMTRVTVDDARPVLTAPWVNIQEPHDFNPTHLHSGLFSYVVWVQIPFKREEENGTYRTFFGPSQSGDFVFSFTDSTGIIVTEPLGVDASWNWQAALFPARIAHSVNPYTSDGVRVTLAGNVYLETPTDGI